MSTEPNRELPKVPGQPEAVPGSESKDTDRVSVMERKLEAMESLLKKNDVLTQAEKELRGQLTILKQKVAKLDRDAVSVSGASRAIEKIETQIDGLHQRIATVRGEVLAVQANVSSVDTTEKVHTPAVEVSKHKKREKEVINQIAPLLDSRSVEPKHEERLLGAIILGDFDGVDSQGIKRELDELKTLSDLSPELKVDAELARGLMQIISTDKIFGKDKPAKLKEYLAKHQDKISKENNPLFFAAKTNADKIIRTYEPEPIKPPASEPVPVVLNPEPTTAVTEPVVEPIAEPPTISESKNTGDNLTGKKEIAFRLFSSVLPPNEFLGVTHYLKPNSDARDTSITRFVIRKRGKNELVDKYLTARQVVQWIRKEHGNRMSNVNEDELLDLFEDWIELKDGVGNGLPEITPDLSKKEAGTVPDRATNKEITSEEFVAALCDRFFRNLRIFPTTNGHYEVVVGPNQRVDLFAVEWKRILPDQDFNRFAEEMGLDPWAISLSKQEISNYILDQVKARDAKVHPEKNDTENIGREGFSEKECQKIIKTVFSGVTLSRREGVVVVTNSEGNTRPYKKFVKEEIFDNPTSFDRLALVYRKITGQSKFDERDVMNRILGFLEATLPADSNLPEPARVTAPVSVPAAPRSDAKERKSALASKVETPEQQAEQLRVRELFADNTHLKVNTISPNHITSTKEGPYNNGKSEAAAELEKSDVLIVGDVHASAWKVMQTLITGGRATMPEDKAKKFAELYSVAIDETKNNGDKITEKFSQTIAEMNECIKTMEWKDSAKPVVFIGDMIADRGLSDSLVLTIINHLKEKAGDNLRITASNHDLGPLLFSISKDQSASFARFPERFNDDQKSREMLRAYYQNLDLFLFNSETKTFISHAPIDQTVINTLAARLGFDFLITEKSVSDFVNEANKWFKKLLSGFIDAARKGNDDLNNFRQSFKADLDLFNSGADSDQGLVWSRRDYAATEELPFGNLPIKYVHGHDSDSRTSSPFSVLNNPQPDSNKPQVINLDNDYRKGIPIDKPGRAYNDQEFNRICVLSNLSGAPFNDAVPKPTTPETESAPAPEVVETKPVTFELFDGIKIDTALAGHHIVIHKDVVRLQNKKDSKKTRSVENFSITYQPKWTAESDFSSEIVVSGADRKVKLRLPISSPQEIEFEYKKTSEIQGLVDKFKNLVAEFDTKNQAVEAAPETAAASSTPPEVVPESTIYHNAAAEGSAIMAPVSLDAGAESLVTSTHTVSRAAEVPPAPPTPPVSSEHHKSSEHHDAHDHHTPPPEIPPHSEHHEAHSSDRLIIDIPEHELARLFPTNALRDFAADLADPNKRDQALVYFKNFFTHSTDKAGLAEQVKKFGYQTLDEFLVHWKTELHQKPLAAFEQWIAQLETNIINEKISWSESLSHGVIWEKTKKLARQSARLLPVALAATAGSAATIALTGGAAIAAAGTAGAISGFFGRYFKKSESFKKTDEEIKARITEKESAIKKERQESSETRDKITAQLKALDTTQFTAFLSQTLRETSAEALHVGEPVNAALLRAHALRVIERGVSELGRAGELAPNETERATKEKLDTLIATLHANSQADKAKIQQLVDKNPVMQKALAKFLELKSGGSTETPDDKFDWGYVGAAAAGAGLSIATTMNSLLRMVPGGFAGGYLGMLYGKEKDKEAQSKAFTEDAAKCLQALEIKLGEKGGSTFTQKHEKNEMYLSTAIENNAADVSVSETKIRTALQLGFLDNRIDLKMRANNILRRIDALKLEQEGSHVAQLDNLMAQLQSNTDSLLAKKTSMIDSLGKRSHLKETLYGIAGAAAGALVGWKGG
ncbi:MAG: hypothetical protein KAZ30_00910, partial [Candidatus Magasanikbacteria bacterium]|nr:hypothetical protein [Candidatus Magasanikbacteria bacterium]